METVSYFYSFILYFLVLELISQENTDDRVRFPAIDLFFKKSIHPKNEISLSAFGMCAYLIKN